MIWDIVDVQDTWDDAIEAINDAIMRKALEAGIRKDQLKFDLPHIADMGYIYVNGTLCLKCKENFACEKHAL